MKKHLLLPLITGLCALGSARADNLRVLAEATPEPGPKHERHIFFRHFDEGAKEQVAFLGVETEPAPAVLAAQLNLPKNTGLVVRQVVPASPAAAVLQENDVLLKLDDQLLIDPHQFAVLIRNHQVGDEVLLTYLRGGKEATAKVKLSQHEVPKMAWVESPPMPGGNFEYRMLDPGEKPDGSPEAMDRVLSLLDQHHGDFGGEPRRIRIERHHGPGLRALSVNPGNSNISYSDDQGSLELTIKDGKKSLVAKNATGEQIFSGPVDTPEERQAMPAEVRARLEQIESMDDFSFKTDGSFHDKVKILRRAQDISLPLPATAPAVKQQLF